MSIITYHRQKRFVVLGISREIGFFVFKSYLFNLLGDVVTKQAYYEIMGKKQV